MDNKETYTHDGEGDYMAEDYRKLDKNKLKNRKRTVATTKDSLKEIFPICWSNEVLNETRDVQLNAYK